MSDFFVRGEAGAASGAIDFVKDAFDDVTNTPTSNDGLTSSALTNPLGDLFGNDDSVKFGAKTLYIKDYVLIEDRTKWVNNKPTYRIIWNENCPGVNGYLFGDVISGGEKDQAYVQVRGIADGLGVTGIIRRVAFLVNDDTAATATGQVVTDGVNGNTVDFSGLVAGSDATTAIRYSAFVNATTQGTQDLHDYRLVSIQANTLKLVGVVVYFENSGANIEIRPGSTYVNKDKITTTAGASLALPSFGSSLGGRALIYKTSSSGYALSALSASTVTSIAQGSNGTNLLALTAGHGSSFANNYGIIAGGAGASSYVGVVQSISTDTLTVSPTLPFGVSNAIYRAWAAGPTYAINASLMRLSCSVDLTQFSSYSGPIVDPQGRYSIWGANLGMTLVSSMNALHLKGASGFLQFEGRCAAMELEYVGTGIHHATYTVNGLGAWNLNEGQTGPVKKTLFTDAGMGWQMAALLPGSSLGILGFKRLNLYELNHNIGQTYGQLAAFDYNQTYTYRDAANATLTSLGIHQRVHADQLYLKGAWTRGFTTTAAGSVRYIGVSTNAIAQFEYYGKDFAMLGVPGGGTLSLNGAGIGLTFGYMHSVATLGFHKVQYTSGNGATSIIEGIDYVRPYGEIRSLQKSTPVKSVASKKRPLNIVRLTGGAGHGAVSNKIRRFGSVMEALGDAITYTDDSNAGAKFVINEDGFYWVGYMDRLSSNTCQIGISINSSELTTGINALAQNKDNWLLVETPGANVTGCLSVTVPLRKGDILRPHTDGTPDTNNNGQNRFTIMKIDLEALLSGVSFG